MITVQLAHHASHSILLAGTGLLDTANEKAVALQATLRTIAGVVATYLVVKRAISTGFAFAAIAIAGLCAGVFMWIVFNVTDLKDRFGNETKAAGATTSQPAPQQAHQPAARHLLLVLPDTPAPA